MVYLNSRVSLDWFLTGGGEMFRSDAQQSEEHQADDNARETLPDVYNLYKNYHASEKMRKDNRGSSLCDTINRLEPGAGLR